MYLQSWKQQKRRTLRITNREELN